MTRRWASRVALLLPLAGVVSGCATVRPYERSVLQSAVMAFPADALQTKNDGHVVGTRESMVGATGSGGSSCGCN